VDQHQTEYPDSVLLFHACEETGLRSLKMREKEKTEPYLLNEFKILRASCVLYFRFHVITGKQKMTKVNNMATHPPMFLVVILKAILPISHFMIG